MIFLNFKYLPYLLIGFTIFSFAVLVLEKKFFKWINEHWFYKRSKVNILSTFFYLIFILVLLISLLDLRGPEEKIKSKIPQQKTIVLIDVSSSMLVEDVRPNRFKKAIFIVKHFIKRSVGHKISITLFSDKQTKIIPFTSDIDLLDSRLGGLENMDISSGGSNLTLAIKETLQYFKTGEDDPNAGGNLLILSDSEETFDSIELDVPKTVSVAFIGVGTAKGGPIPIRNKSGSFERYKEYNHEQVISKLDEEKIKQLGSKIANFKYWIASSYELPTQEIIDFFQTKHETKFTDEEIVTRPVLSHYLISISIVFLIFASILKNFKSFIKIAITALLIQNLYSETNAVEKEYLELFKNGTITKEQKLKLAELFLRKNAVDESIKIYSENLNVSNLKDSEIFCYVNYGTALLMKKSYDEAISKLSQLQNVLPKNVIGEKANEVIKKNILFAIKQKKDQKKNNKEDQNKDQEKNTDKDKNKDKQDKKDEDKTNSKDENKDKKESKDEKNDQNNKNNQANNSGSSSDQSSNNNLDRDYVKRKIPTLLKEIMQEDRKLQEQLIDKNTTHKRDKERRDW